MEVKILAVFQLLRQRSDQGDFHITETDWKLLIVVTMNKQFMSSFSSASYSKKDDDRAWSSQEWKTDFNTFERLVRPNETSCGMIRKIRLGFSHEETLHDGTAQSVENAGNTSWQIVATWCWSSTRSKAQQFIIGNDETELGLSVESRQFVNRANDQVRKRQKNFNCFRNWRILHGLENVHGCDNGISNIHWKELLEQLSVHLEDNRSQSQTNVRHIYKIGVRARWDLWIGNNQLVGRIIHWNGCLWFVKTESLILNAQRSTSLQNLCCVLGRFFKILNLTTHGNKDQDGSNLVITETLTELAVSW